jgi:hypothetical protein
VIDIKTLKKALCLILVLSMCFCAAACGKTEETATLENGVPVQSSTTKKADWKALYKDFLKNLTQADVDADPKECRFTLCYIDGDKIPELVISQGKETDCVCIVVTIVNGEIANTGPYGMNGELTYYEKSGVLIDEIGNGTNYMETICSLENGTVAVLFEGSMRVINGRENHYVEEKLLTEEQYNAVRNKYIPKDFAEKTVTFDKCFEMTEESIDKNVK